MRKTHGSAKVFYLSDKVPRHEYKFPGHVVDDLNTKAMRPADDEAAAQQAKRVEGKHQTDIYDFLRPLASQAAHVDIVKRQMKDHKERAKDKGKGKGKGKGKESGSYRQRSPSKLIAQLREEDGGDFPDFYLTPKSKARQAPVASEPDDIEDDDDDAQGETEDDGIEV